MKRSVLLTIAACLWSQTFTFGAAREQPSPANGQAIEKALVSFRIGVPTWMNAQRFEELLGLFGRYPGVTDEITLFQSATHAPLPLAENERRFKVLAERMASARKAGFRVGINVLATIGHHEENLASSVGDEYGHVMDVHGNVCRGVLCPNDPKVLRYVARLYGLAATAGPDYLWVDDDVRLAGHMPIYLTCFCDRCLAIFAQEKGTRYTRDSLRAAFVEGPLAARLALRKAWLAHNRATIARLLGTIEESVHRIKPGLPLGFMTGDRFYEGYDFDHWAEVLSGPARSEVRWRPGGGFYDDDTTSGLAGKSHDIGRQVSLLPAEVRWIQSEIENFPYQRLRKSAHITALEAAEHIAAGCTGAAFNVLAMHDEPLDEYESMVATLERWRPFYDLLARSLGRRPVVGIRPAWNKDIAAACDLEGGNFSAFSPFLQALSPRMFELGLPVAYAPGGSSVTLLSGDNVEAYSREEIRKILAGGVYMDAGALAHLDGMGLGDLTGLKVERWIASDAIEKLTDHELNGVYAGRERDCRQSFNKIPAAVLSATDPGARTLAGIVDYNGKEVARSTMAIFENRLGGRICVAGYFPWTLIHSLPKASQLKTVMRWLSKDALPVYVRSHHKVHLWARESGDGPLGLALVNSSFDPAEGVKLMVRTGSPRIEVFDRTCRGIAVEAGDSDGPYRQFVLPRIEPWDLRLVVVPR